MWLILRQQQDGKIHVSYRHLKIDPDAVRIRRHQKQIIDVLGFQSTRIARVAREECDFSHEIMIVKTMLFG